MINALSELEVKVLRALWKLGKKVSANILAHEASLPVSSVMSAIELLKSKGLVRVEDIVWKSVRVSDEGAKYINELPEEKLIRVLDERGGSAHIKELLNVFDRKELNIAINWARKRGWIQIVGGVVKLVKRGVAYAERDILRRALAGLRVSVGEPSYEIVRELARRGLVLVSDIIERYVELTNEGLKLASTLPKVTVISRLSSDILKRGIWKSAIIRPYNVSAEPPLTYPGRKHYYVEFLEMFREIMRDLGFEEIDGDYVELEFWNFDALFQAQDHPARDIHDTLQVLNPQLGSLKGIEDLVSRVKEVHENGGSCGSRGWGYRWSLDIARRVILRTHTTALTIKYLAYHKEPPIRVFTIGRVFRAESIDYKHLPEFYQLDGIIMEKDFTFRKLLGLLKEVAYRIGVKELKFKPGYFPFTEPSVEGYVKLEGIGWVEVFGAGLFRPEILHALGIKYPVGAWGLGLERFAMAVLGFNDIRDLFSYDVSKLRNYVIRW
ncbi:MAG: phenylalanine--tRNA ligase subunit alpha [Thermoprotei archaeon]|nr:MAG: phenylalanine--tRNA ligase subunit alpha [Thermoprotei archaeon]